jgi:mono/diheme cytochrome c family protein
MKPSRTRFTEPATVAVAALLVCVLPIATAIDAATAADVAGTYATDCAGCHGPGGSSSTPMGRSVAAPDLRSPAVQQQPDTKLADVIANGTTTMPAFKSSLTNEQIQGLVQHVRGLAKGK